MHHLCKLLYAFFFFHCYIVANCRTISIRQQLNILQNVFTEHKYIYQPFRHKYVKEKINDFLFNIVFLATVRYPSFFLFVLRGKENDPDRIKKKNE